MPTQSETNLGLVPQGNRPTGDRKEVWESAQEVIEVEKFTVSFSFPSWFIEDLSGLDEAHSHWMGVCFS